MIPEFSFNLMNAARFQIGCVACVFAGLAVRASAQTDFLSPGGSTSVDTFGGDPDYYGFIRIPSDTDDWTRHFRIGAMVGMNISANFSEKGPFKIPTKDGIFDDGYVHPDQSGDPNNTSNWGYDKASQYNPSGDGTISMHQITSYTPDSGSSSKEDGGAFPGFDMAYGDNLWYWKHARVGWELGFGLLPISIKNSSPMTATVSQSTSVFGANGIVVPTAPYRGGPSGLGPIISTKSTTGAPETFDNQPITGTRTLDVMLYTFRLGPSFYWDLSEDFGMSLGAGPAIGIASERLEYNETVTTPDGMTRNKGSINGTDMVFGGYINGMLTYHVLSNADIYLGAQYMPLSDASVSGGGRRAELKLGGQVDVSIGVNWPF